MQLTHYFDVTAIPQEELILPEVMAIIFSALHTIIPRFKGEIGVGFPRYFLRQAKFGPVLRVFGRKEALEQIIKDLRATEAGEYGVIGKIAEVPAIVEGYAHFKRVRKKGMSDLRRAKRRMEARGEWSEEVGLQLAAQYATSLKLPFLVLKSQSTGKRFSLWVERTLASNSGEGAFDAYGLSRTRAVPIF